MGTYGYRRPRGMAGFTLIEMMIVVAVITLLAAIGYPSYTEYVTRSNRQAARAMIMAVADRQEQFFLDNKSYAPDLSTLGYAGDKIGVARDGQLAAGDADGIAYVISIAGGATATTYTIEAEPQGVQADRDEACGTLSLTHTGERSASGDGDRCW